MLPEAAGQRCDAGGQCDLEQFGQAARVEAVHQLSAVQFDSAGESQAVRLPKEFRFAGEEVFIKRMGSAVVLLPKAKSWDTLLESLEKFPSDFMSEREQPREVDQRDSLP